MFKLLIFIFGLTLFNFANDKVIDNFSPIDIKLDKDLIDVKSKYTSNLPITCSPPLKNVIFRVNSKNSLSIIPNKGFPSSTIYKCKFKGSYDFEFETQPFDLVEVIPFRKHKLLRLRFNESVNIDSLKRYINIYKKNALAKTKLQYKVLNQKDGAVLIEILEPIGKDEIEISIDGDLETEMGNKIEKNIKKTISLKKEYVTSKLDPKLKKMEIFDKPQMVLYKDTYRLKLFFDDDFDYEYRDKIKSFIEIDGVENFKIEDTYYYIQNAERKELNLSSKSLIFVYISSPDFKPNKSYKVTLKKGLKNYKQLKNDITFEVKTGDLQSFAQFPEDKPYLSNLGDIGFESVNLPKVTLRVNKITPENYRYFIVYANRDKFATKKFVKEIFSKDLTLNSPKNKKVKHKFHISELAKEGAGVYEIVLNYQRRLKSGKIKDIEVSKVVFVSDIGISAKVGENQIFVTTLSLKSTEPIKNATVDILSNKNIVLKSVKTSSDGTAKIEFKNLLEKEPKAVIVSKDGDKNFLLLDNSINKISMQKIKKGAKKYKACIFFQTDIVRPGMTINAFIVLKDSNLHSIADMPIRIELSKRSSDDEVIFSGVYTTDKNGAVDLNISTPYYEKTGAYFLNIYLGDELIRKERINIESFQPPKIETNLDVTEMCFGGGYIDVNISSNYLFGTPASNLSGILSLKAVKGNYKDSIFSDYNFSSPIKKNDDDDYLLIDESIYITLDKNGKATFKLPCMLTNKSDAVVVNGIVGVTIMDGNQPVSTYKDIKIFPYGRVVGIKLSKKIVELGRNLDGWAVLINPLNHKSIDTELIVRVIKVDWFYTYSDGNYKWDSQRKEIDSFRIKSKEKFSYKVPQEGSYEIRVEDPLTGAYATRDFEVSGWGYSTISYGTTPKSVTINFEPKEYKKGDNLKVSIKSPIIVGKLLLTIEKDSVVWHKLYTINKGSASVDIPLNIDLEKGAYLGALVVRKTDTNSSIIPFRAFGFKPIKANRRDKEIKISLDFNKSIKSNSKFSLNISTDREAEVLVSVVDLGILNITNQKAPNPFSFFTSIPELSVAMFDIYDMVIGYITDGKLISFGAGDKAGLQSRKKHLPPPDTKRVKPFMVWSGILQTKEKKATFEMNIPDFNGKARISVVALDNRSIGAKSDELLVKDDIILKPSIPLFLLKGDKLKLPMKIFNTTEKDINLTLNIHNSKNLKITTNESLSFKLKPKEQKEVWLNVEALKKGEAFINFSTNNNGYRKRIDVPIYSPFTLTNYIKRGLISESTLKSITIPEKFKGGKVMLTLSDNALGELRGDLKYLISYPYGCAEQTASRVGALSWSKNFIKDKLLQNKAKLFIREGERKLSKMISYTGEIKYWLNDDYIEPYSSIYASDILLESNSSILTKKSKNSIIEALSNIASLDFSSLEGSYNSLLECYSAYILAREKRVLPNNLNMLHEKGTCKDNQIAKLFLASAYKEVGENKLAREMYNDFNLSFKDIKQRGYYGYPFGGWKWELFTTAYLRAKYFGLSSKEFNSVRGEFNNLYSTQDKALAIRATTAYLGNTSSKDMSTKVKINDKDIIYNSPVSFTTELNSTKIFIDALRGQVSYSINAYKHLPKPIKNRIKKSKEFSISRKFLSKDKAVLNLKNLQLKDEIYAEITISNIPKVDNLIINMRIPSCMEIINNRKERFKGSFADYNIEFNYKDIRDDRVILSTSLKELKKVYKLSNGKSVVKSEPNIHIFYIPLRVVALGECKLPAVIAESMYDERFIDYAKETDKVIVREKALKVASKKINRRDKVEKFVREYYSLEEKSVSPNNFLSFFKFPIKNFFGKKNFTDRDLIKNRTNYNKNWPIKKYKIDSITIKGLSLDSFVVEVEFEYMLKRGRKVINGRSKQYLKVVYTNSNFKIESIDINK